MPQYIVRYGIMRLLGIFASPDDAIYPRGTKLILRTSRGQETGILLSEVTDRNRAMLPDNLEEDRIIRVMTSGDELEIRRIRKNEADEFSRCRAIIRRFGLDKEMNLVRIEHIFGGERIIVYYVSDGRVDFRELVKALAAEFQTRIEMRQIGVRDETKLLSDYGDCGIECCCNSHLSAMPPVSMKMAKMQKATLDPTKISGRCGRLKCCLRYEFDTYNDLSNQLPGIGWRVITPDGPGHVSSHEIMPQKIWVDLHDQRKLFDAAEVQLARGEQNASRPFETMGPDDNDMSDGWP
ncbi:MAG: signal peptidase [Planctomycetaceae bacterium]|nr:signal peptidase [Planctomycetaceae bacterium]